MLQLYATAKELETYDLKQEGASSLTAYIAREAGKVRAFSIPSDRANKNRRGTNRFAIQQFEITFSNNLTNFESLSSPTSYTSTGDWFKLCICEPGRAAHP